MSAADVQRATLRAMIVLGYLILGVAIPALLLGTFLWASDALPAEEGSLVVSIAYAFGQALVALAFAVVAYPLACIVPQLRWRGAWIVVVILANIGLIVLGWQDYFG